MNAHQRHVARRAAERAIAEAELRTVTAEGLLEQWKERAERAEASCRELRAALELGERDVRRAEAERDRVAWDSAETEAQATRVRALVVELERDNEVLVQLAAVRADRIAVLEAHVRQLQEVDRDAAKLRRRLAERATELEQAHARIRELAAGQRQAEAAAPMIQWSRR